MLRHLVTVLLIAALVLPALAQKPAKGAKHRPCDAPPYRQFDFWLGDWVVTGSAGDTLGFNVITPVASGCGFREEWTGSSGSVGSSLTYYDQSDKQWHQNWVSGTGMVLHLAGGLEDETMVLTGERIGRQGPIVDRVQWTRLPDGRVRQTWTYSADEGATWRPLFDGFYAPRD
jgi:hypothetical protein